MTPRFVRTSVLLIAVLIAAACGQKPGVHDESADALPEIIIETGVGGGGGVAVVADGDAGTQTVTDGSTSGGGDDGAVSDGGDGAGAGDDAASPSGGGSASITGSDRTGVTDDSITLAVHAPVTGAAPLPATAFEKARDLYWRYVTEIKGEKVLGRSKVNVQFKDDKYTPNTAIQACRELASSSFLLVGGGGTDQIQACGQFAEQAGVPYLSAGVTEAGLRGLNNYFATSMSYKQQGPLLAAYVKKNFPGKKVGAIVTDTPNFDDAVAGWEDGIAKQGVPYFKTLRHPKGNSSWITSFASDMSKADVDVIFMLTAPTDYIQFAQQSASQGYNPQFVGVGISMGLNALFSAGCPDIDGGIFFSPFPGLDYARSNISEFIDAGKQLGVPTDDIALALWGQAKAQHEMFKRYETTYGSTDLTREDFTKMLATQEGIKTDVVPQLSYSPDNHFGASQVHVLEADCNAEEHKTLATFASGF
ncbi:ABC transporter substrate-binding protein [Actinospongicola halichondriae]|uniref:ABC transporter substrate-binding protein n=1 Tax=Actinospongicola halichondriae TaxID=3236844 RepID=UPI003D568DB2